MGSCINLVWEHRADTLALVAIHLMVACHLLRWPLLHRQLGPILRSQLHNHLSVLLLLSQPHQKFNLLLVLHGLVLIHHQKSLVPRLTSLLHPLSTAKIRGHLFTAKLKRLLRNLRQRKKRVAHYSILRNLLQTLLHTPLHTLLHTPLHTPLRTLLLILTQRRQ